MPISVWKPKLPLPYVIGSKYFSGSTQPYGPPPVMMPPAELFW